jgi:hypothetical protein
MSDSIIIGIFTILGTGLGAWITYASAAKAARIEEQKHVRELGLKVALVNFENCMKLAQSAASAYHETFTVPPLKGFIVQGIKLMEIISDPTLDAQEMARRINASEDFAQVIIHAVKDKTQCKE